jgi:hypothetical protein
MAGPRKKDGGVFNAAVRHSMSQETCSKLIL